MILSFLGAFPARCLRGRRRRGTAKKDRDGDRKRA